MTKLEIIGVLLGWLATLCIAYHFYLTGWILFVITAILWIFIGIRIKCLALVLIQFGYLLFDIIGLVHNI